MTNEGDTHVIAPEPPPAQSNAKPIAIIATMLAGIAVAALVAALSIHGGQQDQAAKIHTVEQKATNAGNKAAAQGKAITKLEIRTVRDHTVLREKQIIGPHGEPGPGGVRGPRGFPGIPGPQGVKGNTGASFTRADLQILLDHIPDAVTASCGGSCKGVQGDTGDTGAPGADGANGKPGADGLPGASGADGSPGLAGPPGADGATGPQGPQGVAGDVGPTGPQGPAGPAPQPFTFAFTDGTGVNHTCTIDPNVGPGVVQGPC